MTYFIIAYGIFAAAVYALMVARVVNKWGE